MPFFAWFLAANVWLFCICVWYISAEVHHIKVLRLWSNLTWRPCRCTLLSPIVSFSWPFRQFPQNPLDYDNRTSQGIFRTMRINWQELASKSVKSPIHKFVFNRFIGIASLWNSCHLNGHNDTSPWFIKMDAWLMGDNHGTAFFSHCRSSSLLFYRSGQCRALWRSARRAVKQGSCKKLQNNDLFDAVYNDREK